MSLERFIAYLDILGFSERVKKEDNLDKFVESYKHCIHKNLKYIKPIITNGYKDLDIMENIKFAIASDTIIIYSTNNTEMDFRNLVDCSLNLLFICFETYFPIRGAIDYGELFVNEEYRIYIGKALINAHDITNKQDWAGVIITDNCMKKIESDNKIKEEMDRFMYKEKVIYYKVPIKDESYIKRPILNWAPMIINSRRGDQIKPRSEKEFREIFLPPWIKNNHIKYDIEKKIHNTYTYYLDHYRDKVYGF
jgi:hypothetical protein